MTRPDTGAPQWTTVDEGWGRKAVDFAALSEPANCREYVTMHHRLGVDAGDRLLDMACGSGLAIELARMRGASCCGIDGNAPRQVGECACCGIIGPYGEEHAHRRVGILRR